MGTYDWLAAVYDTAVFTAIDTETTGLDPVTGRIVEIGAIKFDKYGIIARYNVLINPEMAMPADASTVNGITDDMLKTKPVISEIFPDFFTFIDKTILVAHNAPFDVNYINSELQRNGRKPLQNKTVDTRIFAKEIFRGLQSYALQDIAVQFGIVAIEAHRAEDDARVCMELFNYTLAYFLKKDTELVQKIRSEQPAGFVLEPPPPEEKNYEQSLF
ncbi:MAG: 3'-5' exonuclease [Treponema sp.]